MKAKRKCRVVRCGGGAASGGVSRERMIGSVHKFHVRCTPALSKWELLSMSTTGHGEQAHVTCVGHRTRKHACNAFTPPFLSTPSASLYPYKVTSIALSYAVYIYIYIYIYIYSYMLFRLYPKKNGKAKGKRNYHMIESFDSVLLNSFSHGRPLWLFRLFYIYTHLYRDSDRIWCVFLTSLLGHSGRVVNAGFTDRSQRNRAELYIFL